MANKPKACTVVIVYLIALFGMIRNRPNTVFDLIVYFPLIFLNFVLTMLLVSAGQQLYQKNF